MGYCFCSVFGARILVSHALFLRLLSFGQQPLPTNSTSTLSETTFNSDKANRQVPQSFIQLLCSPGVFDITLE